MAFPRSGVTEGEIRENPQGQVLDGNNVSALIRECPNTTDKLFDLIVTRDNLIAAWHQLKSNPGMMTPGTGTETLNKIDMSWFDKTSKALRLGEYSYPKRRRRSRRTMIPKPNSTETRPLTLSNPRTKIIERAFLNIIEPYFEGM